jgi:RNA polymerase sigma factor (TIGR02999 family)
MGAHPGDYTIEATALAHEAWARLAGRDDARWKDRNHFLAVAAIAMRGILVDEARARGARKRGGDARRVTLAPTISGPASDPIDILDLHEALEALAALSGRQARVVEMRYFGGLTVQEIADTLGVSRATVDGDWRLARAWLARRLKSGQGT